MNRDHFFITDEDGHRYFWKDIEHIQNQWAWMKRHWKWPATVALVLLMCTCLFAYIHLDPWDSYSAIGSFIGFVVAGIFRFPGPGHRQIEQWEREWGYLVRDKVNADTISPHTETLAAQQPHGHDYDEGTI